MDRGFCVLLWVIARDCDGEYDRNANEQSFENYLRTLKDSSEISPKNSSSPYSELAIATDHSLHAPPRHLHLIIIAIEELIQVDQSDQLSAAAFTCLIGLININSYSDGCNGARAATHLLQY